MAHPVMHFEIMGPDGKALQSFYGALFDWEINADNEMDYGMVPPADNGIGGGIAASQDGGPVVRVYVGAIDIQGALDKAEALGATVVMPVTEIPGAVTMALFSDPAGNVVGLVKT